MERRLGKGLGSLLGGGAAAAAAATSPGSPISSGPLEIEIASVVANPFQPRKTMDPAGLEELRDSIRNHGILQPIVVRRKGTGFELIAGERRWRASRLAGRNRIPAVIREDVTDDEMLELALVENVQRRELDPIERSRGYKQMMDRLGLTQELVAAKVGLKRSTVANHLRLLELPLEVQEAVGKGLITMGHARAILGLREQRQMLAMLERVVREDLSVRQVEREIRALQPQPEGASGADSGGGEKQVVVQPAAPPSPQPPWAIELERRLREALGTKASVQNVSGPEYRGKVVLEYFSRDELDRLVEALAPRETL